MPRLDLTGDEAADALLSDNPFALLVGMLLDQQVAMEQAFAAPHRLQQRLGAALQPAAVAATDPAKLEQLFRERPALHRYPGSMAKRVHALATHLVEAYEGEAERLWHDVDDGAQLFRRLKTLPGYGEQKSRILIALLGKQCGVTPDGWRDAAGEYGKEGFRSIADVTDRASLERVRETKRAKKAAAKD